MKGKYLITTYNWFVAPNGEQYTSVFGDVEIMSDNECMNISTNRNSTNWYAIVKGEKSQMIVAGCQIYYAIKTDQVNSGEVPHNRFENGKYDQTQVMSRIYVVP